MKQIISALGIAAITVMASCSTGADTATEAAMQAQQKTIDSLELALTRQQVIDSMNEVSKQQLAAAETKTYSAPVNKKVRRKSAVRSQSYAQNSVGSYAGHSTTPVAEPVVYQEPVAVPEKKGWSAKAKGAVIGGVAGGVAGAVINKRNRTAGAVIGTVLGAGAGTGIGAVIDKKNGR